MKSYIIRIELEETNPVIWRRVVVPAGATFKRLHDIIQNVTNFQGGYPNDGYHLYEFELPEENGIVTDNEEMHLEHLHYKKNRKMYEERLRDMNPEMRQFEQAYQDRLKIEVRKPTRLKVDDYLEKHKEIRYAYDFGDDWHFTVKLERVVEDYHFGFPTLLDGAGTAPPEDVGGIHGFYGFMEVYNDPKDPEHLELKAWAESQGFREYDPAMINGRLKGLSYRKTQWDMIYQEMYKIMQEKYRKGR
ncbi:plasmid pRiA4b ORF-3 family protein [Anaerotalea alkaliphila]|uniref:Plasmid pRiA4b ORF-3 family protein n=1 Tax=Anaerotalea alkaliphila TaxID=2662126 RepID=A0A7X5HW99_9FIRM|nr:plasmid pRiA4b ORF-3 family protein [Anaerotalea alkaliphila]NDL67837.1 plasmid pRiA4b ORF-3 family protein [Anaerotalea alkaliphila]